MGDKELGPITTCSCGAALPRIASDVTHRYIVSTPECWACFSEVVGREYGNPALFGAVHQLTVDAYAAQHPQSQPAKSLVGHLVSLYTTVECSADQREGRDTLKRFVESRKSFPELTPPSDLGPLTIADVLASDSPDLHRETVRRWALQVWRAWQNEHPTIIALAKTVR